MNLALKRILNNTEKDTLTDVILPWLTPVLVGYVINQQQKTNKPGATPNLNIQQLNEIFPKIDKKDQQKLTNVIAEFTKKYSGPNKK